MRRAGYTLIEMLVVIAILVCVVGTVVSVLAAGVSAWESAVRFESETAADTSALAESMALLIRPKV